MKTALCTAVLASAALTASVSAAGFTEDFEGAPPAGYTRTFGTEAGGYAGPSSTGEPALGTTSFKISMPDVDAGYGRPPLTAPDNQPIGKLREVSATFQAYIDNASQVVLPPYLLLGLDNNGDGHYDFETESLVIQFSSQNPGIPATNEWFTEGLNGSNDVHVQVDRGLLAGDAYQPDSTPDKLQDLYDLSYDGTTLWGDLNVYRVRVAAGYFAAGDGDQSYLAYADNINVVPEPASLGLLAVGSLAMLRRRRVA